MMRALVLSLTLAAVLAGCAGAGSMSDVRFEHDFSEETRAWTFDVPTGVTKVDILLQVTGAERPLECDVQEIVRIRVLDPTGKEVVAIEADGSPIEGTSNAACMVVNAQRNFDARAGTWTVLFTGKGDLRGSVTIMGA